MVSVSTVIALTPTMRPFILLAASILSLELPLTSAFRSKHEFAAIQRSAYEKRASDVASRALSPRESTAEDLAASVKSPTISFANPKAKRTRFLCCWGSLD